MAFVSRFKEIEKRKEKNNKRKSKRKRKRKVTEIEIKDAPPLDVFRAHEQEMKTLRNFITKFFLAPDTDPNRISAVVYSVVLCKLDVMQTLVDTLKEHI